MAKQIANRAIVYAIYPNKTQEEQCQKTFGCCRFVYNQMLTVQRNRYGNEEKHLSKNNANNYCNRQLKKAYEFLKEVDKFALTNSIYHLSESYDRYFKHLGKFPKYKKKHKTTAQSQKNKQRTRQNIQNGTRQKDRRIKIFKQISWTKHQNRRIGKI